MFFFGAGLGKNLCLPGYLARTLVPIVLGTRASGIIAIDPDPSILTLIFCALYLLGASRIASLSFSTSTVAGLHTRWFRGVLPGASAAGVRDVAVGAQPAAGRLGNPPRSGLGRGQGRARGGGQRLLPRLLARGLERGGGPGSGRHPHLARRALRRRAAQGERCQQRQATQAAPVCL